MDKLNGAFRKKKVYYSQVSNNAIRDNQLSLKAKGLYALIQSYVTLEGFTLYKNTLKNVCLEGEKAFESTWKELKTAGYLVQYRLQDTNGRFYYEYDLLDEANVDLANEVHAAQNRKTESEKDHTPKKEGMAKTYKNHTPKKEGMENGCNGKGGIYNNTYYNNTYLNNTNNISSSSIDTLENELENNFTENICELKKTTKLKFDSLIKKYNSEMINSVIDECTTTGVKSYRGFEVAFNSYVERGCKTAADVEEAAEKYRENRKKKNDKNKTSKRNVNNNNFKFNNSKSTGFNNFEPRQYDYDSLEKKLLGWEE